MRPMTLDDAIEALQCEADDMAIHRFGETVVALWRDPPHAGRLDAPSASATTCGGCGDTITIDLGIAKGVVTRAGFWTDGCGASVACAAMACSLAVGRSVEEAASLHGEHVLQCLGGLPPDNRHCAFLAAEALRETVHAFMTAQGR
ncbi:MAG: iron-sulfur cluster assembly scaffold protein [Desulfovibrionaceae bacterium]